MPHVRLSRQTLSDASERTARRPLPDNDGRAATIATRQGCRRRRSTVRKNSFRHYPPCRHGLTIPREPCDRPSPRRDGYDVRDGSRPLKGHDCVLKRGTSVGMFERRRSQLSKPEAVSPLELYTQSTTT